LNKSSVQQSSSNDLDTVLWAGMAVAIGSLGVVIASVFYGLSPVAAALPIPNPSIADALNGMIAGRVTMIAAGTIGIIFDLILAAGTLLLMVFRNPASSHIERVGWAFVTISVLIFVMVDSLSAGVLTQIAALDGALAAFTGFKLLFNTLFILGTIAFGLGVPAILVSELKSESPVLAKPLLWIGIVAAAVGFVSGLLYFANVSLPQAIGFSIAAGTFIFAIYGIQIARSTRH
jgi:hypothetical protein